LLDWFEEDLRECVQIDLSMIERLNTSLLQKSPIKEIIFCLLDWSEEDLRECVQIDLCMIERLDVLALTNS